MGSAFTANASVILALQAMIVRAPWPALPCAMDEECARMESVTAVRDSLVPTARPLKDAQRIALATVAACWGNAIAIPGFSVPSAKSSRGASMDAQTMECARIPCAFATLGFQERTAVE